MTYRSGKSKVNKKYINIALGVVAFGLFVYYWPAFQAVTYPIVEPIVRSYGGTKKIGSLVPEFVSSFFSSRTSLIQEKRELELHVEQLENALVQQEASFREQTLLAGIHSTSTTSFSTVILYPVAEDITKLYATLLLSKGYKSGIEKGSLVYVRGYQPVCEVIEVYNRSSRCELLSKGGRETEGVTSSSTISLTLLGEGGGNFIAEVPKGSFVSIGEDVYLRSDPLFKIGTIISVKDEEQATGARIYIRGAYNPVTSSVFYVNIPYAN